MTTETCVRRAKIEPLQMAARWAQLTEEFLPVAEADSIWRFNRGHNPDEPSQGWKLHVSATILDACDLFEFVAPFLREQRVQFKAPKTLEILAEINTGLNNGYHQIGKFLTIYPDSEKRAVELAAKLHELTGGFVPVAIPFDEQYARDSSVFYRYGAFQKREIVTGDGTSFNAVETPDGNLVEDDRRVAVPAWITNPFPRYEEYANETFGSTPLGIKYKIFDAISQRGKGGVYCAVDVSSAKPRLVVVKQGRRFGELNWNSQDGFSLVKNEFDVLQELHRRFAEVPEPYESFEINGNYYFAMEHVPGMSLQRIMSRRRRRFSIAQIIRFGLEVARIIGRIHQAGWIWNDCKPANLVVLPGGKIRPIDFEGSYPVSNPDPFAWKTKGFSAPDSLTERNGKKKDLFALGAVLYFLITGRLYDHEKNEPIKVWRRNVPPDLIILVGQLLSSIIENAEQAEKKLEVLLHIASDHKFTHALRSENRASV